MLALAAACDAPPPNHVPRDPALRREPLYFYTTRDSTRPPRALVFFFGNDVGFWEPHRELAAWLADDGFSVVGFDMRPLLDSLPGAEPARDSAYAARITRLVARVRTELHADATPLVLGGHSLGAEVAIWTAAHAPPPGLVGVLALSPGGRSHLRVTLQDIANAGDPTGPESFSIPATVAAIAPDVRVAVIRGSHDKYRYADSAIVAAGGARARRYLVPFASHSLKRIVVAKPLIRRALDWLLAAHPPGR